MDRGLKRKLVAGGVAAAAIAGGGGAIAADKLGSPKEESQAVVNDAAKQLGVSPTALSNALEKALENRIDAAVAAGRITKAQDDQFLADAKQRITDFVNGKGPGGVRYGFRHFDGGPPPAFRGGGAPPWPAA